MRAVKEYPSESAWAEEEEQQEDEGGDGGYLHITPGEEESLDLKPHSGVASRYHLDPAVKPMDVTERAPDAVYVEDPTATFSNMNDSIATMLW